MGEMMGGIKLDCNIYTFENAEHYISQLKPFDEKSGVCCHKVNEIIEKIKKDFPTAKGCRIDSEYYAAGFVLVTLGNRIAELETECEFVHIEY